MATTNQDREIAISIAPPISLEVEYFNPITRTIMVSNVSSRRILIEDITLRFRSDVIEGPLDVKTQCGWGLEPNAVHELPIDIVPNALYREGTNEFDVKVEYRPFDGSQIGDPDREIYTRPSFIIPRGPKTLLGNVFISLKQPEDLHLGRLMSKLARRAGLEPFLKDDHPRTGDDIWKATIEPALRSSEICIVIWTEQTNWGAQGVEREIDFCRGAGIPEALFLEQSILATPELYKLTTIEYTRFDQANPGPAFAMGIEMLRHRLQNQPT